MATIKDQIQEAMKTAMKSGDKATVGYARNIYSAIRKKEIDDRVDLDDGAVQKVISTSIKQRQDSIEQFRAGNRPDLVANEEAELAFLLKFMPQQLSEAEVRKLVDEAVAESKATTAKDMGNVMKVLMPKLQGRADGKLVNQLVRERLG